MVLILLIITSTFSFEETEDYYKFEKNEIQKLRDILKEYSSKANALMERLNKTSLDFTNKEDSKVKDYVKGFAANVISYEGELKRKNGLILYKSVFKMLEDLYNSANEILTNHERCVSKKRPRPVKVEIEEELASIKKYLKINNKEDELSFPKNIFDDDSN